MWCHCPQVNKAKIAWKLPFLVLCKIISPSPTCENFRTLLKKTHSLPLLSAALIVFFSTAVCAAVMAAFLLRICESRLTRRRKLKALFLAVSCWNSANCCMFNKAYLLEAKQLMQWQAQWCDTADLMKHWVPLAIFPKNARENAC